MRPGTGRPGHPDDAGPARAASEPEPPRDRAPVTERIATGPSRGTGQLVALVVALVAVAIAKPWDLVGAGRDATGFGTPVSGRTGTGVVDAGPTPERSESGAGPSDSGPSVAAPASGAPASSPETSPDPDATACMSANGERLVTLIRTSDEDVRTWQRVDGGEGHDAFQPGLVPVRIPSQHVVGLGLCADQPDQRSGARAAAEILDVILVDAASGGIEDLGRPLVISAGNGPLDAVLYGPPASLRTGPTGTFLGPQATVEPTATGGPSVGPGSRLASWAAGSYAAAFHYPDDPPGVVRWLRFDVIAAPGIYG